MAKLNNRRIYTAANHQPRHKAQFRLQEAKERQAAYDKLSLAEKIKLLDTAFGVGLGATRQRARLNSLLNKSIKPTVEEIKTVDKPVENKVQKKNK